MADLQGDSSHDVIQLAESVTSTCPEEEAMTTKSTGRRFSVRCALLLWHDIVVRSAEDGSRYRVCRRCGRERSSTPGGSVPL